jgi:hypothetical protein
VFSVGSVPSLYNEDPGPAERIIKKRLLTSYLAVGSWQLQQRIELRVPELSVVID